MAICMDIPCILPFQLNEEEEGEILFFKYFFSTETGGAYKATH